MKFVILAVIAGAFPMLGLAAECTIDAMTQCTTNMMNNLPENPAENIQETCSVTNTYIVCLEGMVGACDSDTKKSVMQQLAQAKAQMGQQCGEGAAAGPEGCIMANVKECTDTYMAAMPQDPQNDIPALCKTTREFIGCFEQFIDNCPEETKNQFQQQVASSQKQLDDNCGSGPAPECTGDTIKQCAPDMMNNLPKNKSENIEETCSVRNTQIGCLEGILGTCDGEMRDAVLQQLNQAKEQMDQQCRQGVTWNPEKCSLAKVGACRDAYLATAPKDPQNAILAHCRVTKELISCFDEFIDHCPEETKNQFQQQIASSQQHLQENCSSADPGHEADRSADKCNMAETATCAHTHMGSLLKDGRDDIPAYCRATREFIGCVDQFIGHCSEEGRLQILNYVSSSRQDLDDYCTSGSGKISVTFGCLGILVIALLM